MPLYSLIEYCNSCCRISGSLSQHQRTKLVFNNDAPVATPTLNLKSFKFAGKTKVVAIYLSLKYFSSFYTTLELLLAIGEILIKAKYCIMHQNIASFQVIMKQLFKQRTQDSMYLLQLSPLNTI